MENSEFVNYIKNPLTIDQMNLLYKANDVKFDRCNLYYDFIKSLNKVIVDTYLGTEYIVTDREVNEHYLWCFNSVVDNFKEESIVFDDVVRLKEYFFYFYDELFYKDSDKVLNKLDNLAEFSFDFHRIKSRSDIDIMIELYKLFEKSLYFKTKK
jgi:hypothetical protein